MNSEVTSISRPMNVAGYEALAQQKLPRAVYDYYAGGAEDETTLRANRAAFERYMLRPRVLVDVSNIDMTTRVGNDDIAFPVMLAPAAFQQLADAEGEQATARAATAAGTILVASSLSNYSIEDITAAA